MFTTKQKRTIIAAVIIVMVVVVIGVAAYWLLTQQHSPGNEIVDTRTAGQFAMDTVTGHGYSPDAMTVADDAPTVIGTGDTWTVRHKVTVACNVGGEIHNATITVVERQYKDGKHTLELEGAVMDGHWDFINGKSV